MFFRRKQADGATVIGPGAVIEGSLRSDQPIVIQGRVNGTVESSAAITIGASGIVYGDVQGDEVTVGGRIEGTVTAGGRLMMVATGTVHGDALYGMLEVDRGGVIEGRTTPLPGASALPVLDPDPEPRLLPSPPIPLGSPAPQLNPPPTPQAAASNPHPTPPPKPPSGATATLPPVATPAAPSAAKATLAPGGVSASNGGRRTLAPTPPEASA